MIRFHLLGQPRLIRDDGEPLLSVLSQPRRLALLALVALGGREGVRRELLLELFWPDAETARGRNSLNQGLHYLRRALGDDAIPSRPDGTVLLSPAHVWCDASALQEAYARRAWEEAVALYGGDLLTGFTPGGGRELEGHLTREADRLRRLAMRAAWKASERAEADGRAPDAVRYARRAAALAPLEEVPARRLISLLARVGDRSAAVEAFEALRTRLADELELEPSTETLSLVREIRNRAFPRAVGSGGPDLGGRKTEPADVAAPVETTAAAGRGGTGRSRTGTLPGPPPGGSRPRKPALVAVALVASLLLVAGLSRFAPGSAPEATAGPLPSVAVLPVRALLADSADRWFAEGLQEEILTQLTKLDGIVLLDSRSVSLAGGRSVSLADLSGRLGARYVLDLSVQRDSARVKVTARLVDAEAGRHVWGEILERAWKDAFIIQGEITTRVADALQTRITPRTRRAILASPTENREAWELYLHARALEGSGLQGGSLLRSGDWPQATAALDSATTLDPEFALAWARLAMMNLRLYWWGFDREGRAIASARRALEQARALAPELSETRLTGAYFHYWAERDREAAWEAAAALTEDLPGNVDLVALLGAITRRRASVEESLPFLERATDLDPLNPFWRSELIASLMALGRFEDVEAYLDRIEPLFPPGRFDGARWHVALRGRGDTEEALRVVLEHQGAGRLWGREYDVRLIRREYDEALAVLDREGRSTFRVQEGELPIGLLYARAHLLRGDTAEARRNLGAALPGLQELVEVHPEAPSLHPFLAEALAGLGRCSEALAQLAKGEAAADGDLWESPHVALEGVPVRVRCGDFEGTLERLGRLLEGPVYRGLSVPWLRVDPRYDPIRKDPRFQRLLEAHG